MFCTKCGKEIEENAKFCSNCGQHQFERKGTNESENKAKLYAFYVAIMTSPVLFIIRMLSQTSEHIDAGTTGAWKSYDTLLVPGNIKAIMILILIISTIFNFLSRKDNQLTHDRKSTITKIMLIMNILFGIFITFVEF